MEPYGIELILDLSGCDPLKFTRSYIKEYFVRLCDLIDMERSDMHFWDDLHVPESQKQTNSKTIGTSAIQFILTSNVTIHTLDLLEAALINIFSCKEFNTKAAIEFSIEFFAARRFKATEVRRSIP